MSKEQKFTSIDVERINIVEKDGSLRMALFNGQNMPPLLFQGEDILPGHRQGSNTAGIMFYNGEGTECGGLIFGSNRKENGEFEAGVSLTFDQYNQDQVLQLLVVNDNGQEHYGFTVYDRPKMTVKDTIQLMNRIEGLEAGPEKQKLEAELDKDNYPRLFVGKNSRGEVAVKLNDRRGRERIRMVIDQDDNPRLEFLDSEGNVTYSLPPEKE